MRASALKVAAYAALSILSVAMAACSKKEAQSVAAPQAITIDGSSTVFPLASAVAQDFAKANPAAVAVNVSESGTASGFEKLCSGAAEIIGASRPIRSLEMVACLRTQTSYVEVPIAFDGVTVIAHPALPISSVTLEQLKAIWAPEADGEIKNWRDVSPRWPNTPMTLFSPGQASGTFEYFTEVIEGEARRQRADVTASEDDAVIVEGVANTVGAVGYLGLSYYEKNKDRLKALAVDSGAGPVAPSAQTVLDGTYKPLSRPIFFYVSLAALDRPEVAQFAEYYVANAGRFATDVGYIALPEGAYAEYLERVRGRRFGTAFGGRPHAGETIEQVIARPLAEAQSE